jgi:hypothetical protein
MPKFQLVLLLAAYLAIPAWGYYQMQRHAPAEATDQTAVQADSRQEQGRQVFSWGLIAIGIAVLGNMPLMGLPGMLVVGIGKLSGVLRKEVEGERLWPAAIMATLIFPLGISLGVLAKNLAYPQGGIWLLGLILTLWLAGTILILRRMA